MVATRIWIYVHLELKIHLVSNMLRIFKLQHKLMLLFLHLCIFLKPIWQLQQAVNAHKKSQWVQITTLRPQAVKTKSPCSKWSDTLLPTVAAKQLIRVKVIQQEVDPSTKASWWERTITSRNKIACNQVWKWPRLPNRVRLPDWSNLLWPANRILWARSQIFHKSEILMQHYQIWNKVKPKL